MTNPDLSEKSHPLSMCQECQAQCCRHVALRIDTPTCKEDYDHVRWYLMHEGVKVFIDHDNDWMLEFAAPCKNLGHDLACADYTNRPRICRRYPGPDNLCEYESDELPHKKMFCDSSELEQWLDQSGIDWKFKRF